MRMGRYAGAKKGGVMRRGNCLEGSENVLAMQKSVDQLRIPSQTRCDDTIDNFQYDAQEIVIDLHFLYFPSRTPPLLGSFAQAKVPGGTFEAAASHIKATGQKLD
jgi:hypothetical protein